MHVVEVYWVVMPNFGPLDAELDRPGVPASACFGVYIAAVLRGMEDYSLVAVGDPRLGARARVRERIGERRRWPRTSRSPGSASSRRSRVLAIVTLLVARVRAGRLLRPRRAGRGAAEGRHHPTRSMSLRADEEQRLTSGAMPIDKAMQTLATKGRMGASPDIMPSASKDIAPAPGLGEAARPRSRRR